MTGEHKLCTDNSAIHPLESARIHEEMFNNWDRTSQKATSLHKAYSIDWVTEGEIELISYSRREEQKDDTR